MCFTQARLNIPDTGHHGSARLAAVAALATALGCETRDRDLLTGHYDRGAGGSYYLTVCGPPHLVTWLCGALPQILAALDTAASAAARRYAAWLRQECPPGEHAPAELPALRTRWRRAYLRAYATAVAARLTGHGPPGEQNAGAPGTSRRHRGGHAARWAAEDDAGRADLAVFTPPPP
jgi:hypothetical protein